MEEEKSNTQEQAQWNHLLRQSWITTRLERDKAIITLSSAGLGLVVLFITKNPPKQCFMKLLLVIGIVGFTAAIIGGVRCLHINGEIIQRELKREPEKTYLFADALLYSGFLVGVVFLTLIGFATIF